MSDDNKLKKIINKIIKEYVKDNPPSDQLKFACIVSTKTLGNSNMYSLKILDQSKDPDSNFPIIPNIKDAAVYNKGDIVVIGILYGQEYCILKKVEA